MEFRFSPLRPGLENVDMSTSGAVTGLAVDEFGHCCRGLTVNPWTFISKFPHVFLTPA